MTTRKTRIVCTIGDIRKDFDIAGFTDNASRFKDVVRQKLARDIQNFIQSGMNVARINMAHFDVIGHGRYGTLYPDKEYLQDVVEAIRNATNKTGQTVAIMGDIQGPKVRLTGITGEIQKKVRNDDGSLLRVCLLKENLREGWKQGEDGEDLVVGMRWEGGFNFIKNIEDNQVTRQKDVELHIGDAGPILRIYKFLKSSKGVLCEVKPGAEQTRIKEETVSFGNGDGVSVKNSKIKPGDYILDGNHYLKDEADLRFLLGDNNFKKPHNLLVDFIALSFVKSNADTGELQRFIKRIVGETKIEMLFGVKDFPIISKIEDQEGITNLSQIIETSYGIMVGRGDLGLHCPIQKVALYQKDIIDMCNQKERPVIVATQMLESMITNPEPSRAESTDVFNAVIDGADALMLSGETAKGRYRRESIEMMAAIIKEAEDALKNRKDYEYRIAQLQKTIVQRFHKLRNDLIRARHSGREEFAKGLADLDRREDAHHIAYSACEKAYQLDCGAIIALSESGGTARLVSRYKPETRLIAGVYSERAKRVLMLSYGVEPVFIEKGEDHFSDFEKVARRVTLPKRPEGRCQRVITVAGYPYKQPGTVTFLNILHY
ncbi:MAG: pyruvate kinase [Chloroflexota bacterium]